MKGSPGGKRTVPNSMLCQLCFHLFLPISASVSLTSWLCMVQPCLDIQVSWFPLPCSRFQAGRFWFPIDFIFHFKIFILLPLRPRWKSIFLKKKKKKKFNKIEMNTLFTRKLGVELHPSPPRPQPDYLFCKYLNSSNWLPFLCFFLVGNLTYSSKDHTLLHNQVLSQKFSPNSWTEFTEF